MPGNGLAPQIEAHEDRLQRVEMGVSDLRVKVAEVSIKQDLHQHVLLSKIAALTAVDDEVKIDVARLNRKGKSHGFWALLPVRVLKRYAPHITGAMGGALLHFLYHWYKYHV